MHLKLLWSNSINQSKRSLKLETFTLSVNAKMDLSPKCLSTQLTSTPSQSSAKKDLTIIMLLISKVLPKKFGNSVVEHCLKVNTSKSMQRKRKSSKQST